MWPRLAAKGCRGVDPAYWHAANAGVQAEREARYPRKWPKNWHENASNRSQLHLLKNNFLIAIEDGICSECSSHALQMDKYWLLMTKVLTVRMLWKNYQTRHGMQVLRFPAVSRVTGLPRSTLYLYMKNNQFPKPMKLGVRSVGWIKEEVDEWLRQKRNSRSL